MYTDTEAVILRQTKTLNGRRMITIFSQKYGKISAGTSISEKGKNKSDLALRPFCYGRYELYKNKDSFNINGAEVIRSFYKLGEDVDKYFAASYVLEFTDQILAEDEPQPALFRMLVDFLSLLEARKTAYDTLLIAYQIKALELFGSGIGYTACMRTGEAIDPGSLKGEGICPYLFSVEDGGLIARNSLNDHDLLNPLIFEINTGIIQIISYISRHPLNAMEKLAIPEASAAKMKSILSAFISWQLGIDKLKSEGISNK